MIGRDEIMDTHRPVLDPAIDKLLVQLATAGGSLLLAVILVTTAISGELDNLARVGLPLATAVTGWIMLGVGRPRAVLQLIVSMGVLVAYAVFSPASIPGDPILGLLVMAIGATVLIDRWTKPFMVFATFAIGFTSLTWNAETGIGADQVFNALVAMISYGLTAWLLLWLRARAEHDRRELQQLIRSKDEFVATVSHELRTPLTTIMGLIHEMNTHFDRFTRSEIDEFIDVLVQESTDVTDIVDDLLVAARAEMGTLALHRRPLSLHDELAAALKDSDMVRLDASGLPEIAVVEVDGLRFRQIVRNLLVNAARYGGSDVRVVAHRSGRTAFIEVRDDGAPIPVADRELIFEPYHRASHRSGTPGSTGLGLTVSRRLARLMDGDVSYRHDGNDSVFILSLPLVAARPSFAAAS